MADPSMPCPFCGSIDLDFSGGESDLTVQCQECLAEGPVATVGCRDDDDGEIDLEAEAVELWDKRRPLLLRCPAAVRFVSYEPALDAVNFRSIVWWQGSYKADALESLGWPPEEPERIDALTGDMRDGEDMFRTAYKNEYPKLDLVIVGSESGPGARPMDIAWARKTVDDCLATNTAVFVKQIANEHDRKGGDPQFWPPGNWPRQFPKVQP